MRVCLTTDPLIITGGIPLIGQNKNFWKNDTTIRIGFLNGNMFIRGKVQEYAIEWLKYANIRFDFVSDGPSEIRIGFNWDNDDSSWSKVGTIALYTPQNFPTMNFDWFSNDTSNTEFRRITLHEFGHMLGFYHEHQSPLFNIPWDKVYEYYMGPASQLEQI